MGEMQMPDLGTGQHNLTTSIYLWTLFPFENNRLYSVQFVIGLLIPLVLPKRFDIRADGRLIISMWERCDASFGDTNYWQFPGRETQFTIMDARKNKRALWLSRIMQCEAVPLLSPGSCVAFERRKRSVMATQCPTPGHGGHPREDFSCSTREKSTSALTLCFCKSLDL
ncbi:hypothetical protein CAPTEDRAFT_192892 [Capitella teleta]|uniref:Uncharacterized protein n=1 Tax=Capitella teleta TaxID=283909 RepID=R7TWM6_CAPTE|nr:hypothetical protein CAPTEDRAFT_192892 [Capitella teleta]|eukprot:ELT98293.1 hypothetical protein CAPTEDRAFT_192892 [Capitella teleta]